MQNEATEKQNSQVQSLIDEKLLKFSLNHVAVQPAMHIPGYNGICVLVFPCKWFDILMSIH